MTGPAVARVSPIRTEGHVRALTADDLLEPAPSDRRGSSRLRRLTVSGLLSFGSDTQFEFGRLNLLVGPNGAGKSNLLHCLRVLQGAPFDIQGAFGDAGYADWGYKGRDRGPSPAALSAEVDLPGVPAPVLHELRFSESKRPPGVVLASVEEAVRDAASLDPSAAIYFLGSPRAGATIATLGARRRQVQRVMAAHEYNSFQSILAQVRDATQYPQLTGLATYYAGFRVYSDWSFGRQSPLRESAPANSPDAILSESTSNLPIVLSRLAQTPAHERIRTLLAELKETYADYATRIFPGRVSFEIIERALTAGVPASRLSDGTLRFLALAAILLSPEPPTLVCLEEPELGMHPDMIRLVAKLIADAGTSQLIVSTHSEHLVSALQDDFDALFAFDAGDQGTSVNAFTAGQFREWRDTHSLGELWTSGHLGGNRW